MIKTRLALARGVFVTVAVAWAVGACAAQAHPRSGNRRIVSRDPEQFVRLYLDAAERRDCAMTRTLTLDHTWSWCDDPRLLSFRHLSHPMLVPASEAGIRENCVDFDIHTNGSSDGTVPRGWSRWGLCLVHTPSGWRVYDQGAG